MEKLVLSRNPDTYMAIKKLPEYVTGGRNPDDAIGFIDYNDNVRVAGVTTGSKFGAASPECPGITLTLPNQRKASKLYMMSRNVYIISDRGELYASGENSRGQCFLPAGGGTANLTNPTLTSFTSNCVKLVQSSDVDPYSAMVLLSDGTVYSAGANQFGQLGVGTQTDSGNTGPKLTLGPGNTFGNPTVTVSDVISIGSFDGTNIPESYCALLSDGTVWCVGYGNNAQMGNGITALTNSTWKQVIRADNNAILTNIVRIGGCSQDGGGSFYALDNTGVLWSWGYNVQGQLGVGNNTNQNKATRVTPFGVGVITDIFPMNGNFGSIIVRLSDNSYWSCGVNNYGQLGLGDTTNRNSFVRITSLDNKDISMIYQAGYDATHVFALSRSTNKIYATGYNGVGNLGLGNITTPITSFTEVPFYPTCAIVDIMPVRNAGVGNYTLILTADGNTYFAGQSRYCYVGKPDRNVVNFSKNTRYLLGK